MSDLDQNHGPATEQRLSRTRQQLANGRPANPDSLPASVKTPPSAGEIKETGGPAGPEPTRYGDWERKGRCIDF